MWSAISDRFWELVGGKDEDLWAYSDSEPAVSGPVICSDLVKPSQFCLRSRLTATIGKETV